MACGKILILPHASKTLLWACFSALPGLKSRPEAWVGRESYHLPFGGGKNLLRHVWEGRGVGKHAHSNVSEPCGKICNLTTRGRPLAGQ